MECSFTQKRNWSSLTLMTEYLRDSESVPILAVPFFIRVCGRSPRISADNAADGTGLSSGFLYRYAPVCRRSQRRRTIPGIPCRAGISMQMRRSCGRTQETPRFRSFHRRRAPRLPLHSAATMSFASACLPEAVCRERRGKK